jgi:hypothetical protein
VPVNFASLPTNIGAVTLKIMFDPNKLSFIDLQNNTFGANAGPPTGGKIVITWVTPTFPGGTNINGLFLNLRFLYIGGGATPITFTDGCEVSNSPAAQIVPVTWMNGGVNVSFMISGLLRYDNTPNPLLPLVGFTVYLKQGVTTIASTLTDGTGHYSFMAPNGNYTLSATARPGDPWYGDLDDVTALFDYVLSGGPLAYETPLRLTAGDVVVTGVIDLDDVVSEFNRVLDGTPPPDFTAPDWLFDNPAITVSGADLPNQNFFGLCAGDVLGNNPTP